MSRGRLKMTHYLIWALILCLLILYRVLGIQGKMVLAGAIFFGLAVLIMGALMIWLFIGGYRQGQARALIATLVVGLLLMGYGMFKEVQVIRDIDSGTVITDLSNCYITSRSGIHGIIGFHYYLNGTDRQGIFQQFPLSFASRDRLEGIDSVTVEYYENVGRIVNCY